MRPILLLADWIRHRALVRHAGSAQAQGPRGEDLAHRYLQKQGLRVVARNLQLPPLKAELDIVATDGDTFVFVEVKTRATDDFGRPEDAVDSEKRTHLVRAARAYLRAAGADWNRARFDVVSIVTEPAVRIEHRKDAFRSEDFYRAGAGYNRQL